MSVIKLDIMNLRDPVTSLKTLSEWMERGEAVPAKRAVVVSVEADGHISLYGYGDNMDEENCLALLSRSVQKMASYLNNSIEEEGKHAG
jgi:hypothetical protein